MKLKLTILEKSEKGKLDTLMEQEGVVILNLIDGRFSVPYMIGNLYSWSVGATKYTERDVKKKLYLYWKEKLTNEVKELLNEAKEIVILVQDRDSVYTEFFEKFLRKEMSLDAG